MVETESKYRKNKQDVVRKNRFIQAIPDLRYLSPEQHELFPPTVFGLREDKGMPPFWEILEPAQVEQVHQYIIKRSHYLREELTRGEK